ncbi:MAG: beta-hexosaminidase [Actinomycetota bacterium]|nr:beta-hexosaminidase [Actinomycetota bacterium]
MRRPVEAMSVRQLAHQLQVVTVAGRRPHRVSSDERAANMRRFGVRTPAGVARTFRPGGMVYFDQNVSTPQQVRALSGGLHRASRRAGLPTLLFTDQEGGLVSRLPGPVADRQPAARELGGDPRLARTSARRMGSAMAGMGLDADFAPVADVDTVGGDGVIGTRAFGSGPGVVSRMVRQQICGYHRSGVAVSLKHWPGHGSTSVDSHQALPQLSLPLRSWRSQHLAPFAAGVRAGADMVMTGHLAYERLDPSGRPASLSPRMTRGWLRGRLGFDGVIVTDSLSMSAVAAPGTAGRVAVQALRAGADLLLMSPSPTAAADGIRAAVANGRLTRARLERSALRVLRLKQDAGLLNRPQRPGRC